jgi:phage tail sheath protein FI
MSLQGYHHGTRLMESNEVPVLFDLAKSAVIALLGTAPDADAAVFPANVPVLLAGDPTLAASLGDTGTLKAAVEDIFDQAAPLTVIIRVEEGADAAATMSNMVGDTTTKTGVHALKKCLATTGVKPWIIALPGFTLDVASPEEPSAAVAELTGVLDELESFAYIDGPDTTDAAALTYQGLIASGRCEVVDVKSKVWDTALDGWVYRPSAARFAGVRALIDHKLGAWHPSSNKPLKGIGGVSRVIAYGVQSDLLNEGHVSTIINLGNGPITWGSRTTSGESVWAFTSVRRTADLINGAVRDAYLEFVDKPFSAANIRLMLESGNAAMRNFKAIGAILGGKVWMDAKLNEPTQLAQGKITFSIDFEPPAPMEDIRFVAHRNIEYYLDLTKDALTAAA